MIMYFESDYDKHLREQRVNNAVKDYGILVRPKVSDASVSYSESDTLKLANMVLNINENNTVDFDINGDIDSDVCIGNNDLVKLKRFSQRYYW